MMFLEISPLRPAMYQQSRTSGVVWSANPPDSKTNGGSISINSDIGRSIEFVSQASSSNRARFLRCALLFGQVCVAMLNGSIRLEHGHRAEAAFAAPAIVECVDTCSSQSVENGGVAADMDATLGRLEFDVKGHFISSRPRVEKLAADSCIDPSERRSLPAGGVDHRGRSAYVDRRTPGLGSQQCPKVEVVVGAAFVNPAARPCQALDVSIVGQVGTCTSSLNQLEITMPAD